MELTERQKIDRIYKEWSEDQAQKQFVRSQAMRGKNLKQRILINDQIWDKELAERDVIAERNGKFLDFFLARNARIKREEVMIK